ncbi:DMT family transporter [Thioalkalicoccus limnaeus]|uniref:DMT family transporter n=1 Tax=Thioalkalicoccus limnaeus TaxID=120681 RepID=A0ABV4BHY7_9GAMM
MDQLDWLTLSLICAFSLASADAATKAWLRDYSTRELTLIRFTLTGVLMTPLLAGLPPLADLPVAFWGWIAILLPLEILAMLMYMAAIRDHPLSQTLPYLAFTPAFVILIADWVLGEKVSAQGAVGILLIVGGSWLLNVQQARAADWRTWAAPLAATFHQRGSRMMLAVALLYAVTATLGKGALQYMAPEHFGAFYFLLLGAATLVLIGLPRPGTLLRVWRRPWAVLIVTGLNAIMVTTHFLAIQLVEVAYMIAVKRLSLVIGILYGAWLFHEAGLRQHLMAAGLMLTGVFLIAW